MSLAARLLNTIERVGNRLPDPVFLFLWLILGLIVLSLIGAGLGWSAVNPVTGDVLQAESLLSPANLERLFIGMPRTLADFPPLGIVITIIYGASVAERTGMFSTAIRGALLNAPRFILTPIVVVTGMVSHHASDASYVVVIPWPPSSSPLQAVTPLRVLPPGSPPFRADTRATSSPAPATP